MAHHFHAERIAQNFVCWIKTSIRPDKRDEVMSEPNSKRLLAETTIFILRGISVEVIAFSGLLQRLTTFLVRFFTIA